VIRVSKDRSRWVVIVLVKLNIEGYGELVVEIEELGAGGELISRLPFSSKVETWKEEVYFKTPLERVEGKTVSKVEGGAVALWPPGKALCVFYGVSQPYSPVVPIGEVVGPYHTLSEVKSGVEVKVEEYPSDEGLPLQLRKRGICAAERTIGGESSVVMNVRSKGKIFRFEAFEEDYGISLEGEALFKRTEDYAETTFLGKVKRLLSRFERVRVDVNEEGYLILSAYAEDLKGLVESLNQLVEAYEKVYEILG